MCVFKNYIYNILSSQFFIFVKFYKIYVTNFPSIMKRKERKKEIKEKQKTSDLDFILNILTLSSNIEPKTRVCQQTAHGKKKNNAGSDEVHVHLCSIVLYTVHLLTVFRKLMPIIYNT